MRYLYLPLPLLLIAASLLPNMRSAEDTPSIKIHESATEFLATLSDPQKAKAKMAYEGAERVKWAFIPLETRKGMPLMDMSEPQKAAALKVLRSIVSQAGFDKSKSIMSLENVLRQLEGPKSHERRNPEKYYFSIYGTPSATGLWGLSIEGHHLSLNFVLENGKIVDSTPQFFASNPATLKETYGASFPKGMRVLQGEEQIAMDLVQSLDESQKKKAIVASKAPADIRWAGEVQPHLDPAQGIPASELNAKQKQMLRDLMKVYSDSMRKEVSEQRWKMIEDAGFDKIQFAWSGATEPGIGHYYTVQGPTFLIEFVNVQADAAGNPANHIHCVWHDMTGDFNLPITK